MANVKKDVGIENERERALDAAIAKIRKEHGEGAIMKLTDDSIRNIEVIPSGCLGLDLALGIGGLPR
ncbi:MAG: DNA recombination/repair protein RecA, partial [Clostridia bacterium]|nr:DNA recombination/repair protein RecA [Clostridia bacterium]